MKSFKEMLIQEGRKIKNLDPRYGTTKDPRLDITSDKVYKESGSGTGIWRSGLGHNPNVFGVQSEKPIMTDAERTEADIANRSREFAKRKKGSSREELKNRFDPFTATMTVPEIGEKLGLSKSRTDAILKGALAKIKTALGRDFDPSEYSNEFSGKYSRKTKRSKK